MPFLYRNKNKCQIKYFKIHTATSCEAGVSKNSHPTYLLLLCFFHPLY